MLARPTRRATYHRALGSGELIPQNERELRRSERSGMLIGDPLVEGSSASSTDGESGELIPQNERNSASNKEL